MKKYDKSVKINHNPSWLYISIHSYRILIIGGSGSGKTNVLLNLININNKMLTKFIYMPKIHEAKCQLLINGGEKVGIKHEKKQRHLLIIHKQLMMSMKF